MVHEKTMLLE